VPTLLILNDFGYPTTWCARADADQELKVDLWHRRVQSAVRDVRHGAEAEGTERRASHAVEFV